MVATIALLCLVCLGHGKRQTAMASTTRMQRQGDFKRDTFFNVNNAADHISPEDAQVQLEREAQGLGKKVISMSLYGDGKEYLVGAIENAVLVQRDWPGWTLRVFHDTDVPTKTLDVLRALDVELVPSPGKHGQDHAGLLLRYTVLQDPNVTRFLIRDADARLSRRDRQAVNEWVTSNRYFHVVRDHPYHRTEIMGGVWGAVGGFIRPAMLSAVIASTNEVPFNEDQLFLRKYVWPHVRQHALTHDSYHCQIPDYKTMAWRPFPTRRLHPSDFIGNKYEDKNDYIGMLIQEDCPMACRKKPQWNMC